MKEKEVVFYCFNEKINDSKVVKCDLKKAHELFNEEAPKIEDGSSPYTYADITVNGSLLRSCFTDITLQKSTF